MRQPLRIAPNPVIARWKVHYFAISTLFVELGLKWQPFGETMIRQAVILDSDMSAGQALRRLAEHGYWLRADAPIVRSWLSEYVTRIRKIASSGQAPEKGWKDNAERTLRDTSKSMPSPIKLSVDDAARLLARPVKGARVVIRHQDGGTIYWYARRTADMLGILAATQTDDSLTNTLNLEKPTCTPVAQLADLDDERLERFVGVVLRGQQLVGVSEQLANDFRFTSYRTPFIDRPKTTFGEQSAGSGDLTTSGEVISDVSETADTQLRVYPRLDAPPQVAVGKIFEVEIGISELPHAGTASTQPMTLQSERGATEISIDLEIVADGFAAPQGWRNTLTVPINNPASARIKVSLVALPLNEKLRLTLLVVNFLVGGLVRGTVSRRIVVSESGAHTLGPDVHGEPWLGHHEPTPALNLAEVSGRPDIELDIIKPDGNPSRGSYQCVIRNAHNVPVPNTSLPIELGDDANTFAKKLIDDVRLWSGEALVDRFLENSGDIIAKKLPREFWGVLRAVADKVKDRPVTFQLNSSDPYVPWELAIVEPPLDPIRPRFLGSQVVMGRWIIGDASIAAPPRETLSIRSMAIMAGMYNRSTGLQPLPQAVAEAKALTQSYEAFPAIPLESTATDLKALLDASLNYKFDAVGGVEIVHFAGHGEVDPTRPGDAAIYLSNGKPLSPIFFRRSKLGLVHSPFIFLNACMVGNGGEMLGDYGGFPGNCLAGGFCGLVAPLWAVDDNVAKAFALEFYRQVLDGAPGRTVAETLRELRGQYRGDTPVPSYLAYVFYGNPHLRLSHPVKPANAEVVT